MEGSVRMKGGETLDFGGVLGAVVRPQTYKNILYLLFSFPLGIFYFVLLCFGFSLGIGLSIILIGIPILLLFLLACRGLVAWERWLAIQLLDAHIPRQRGVVAEWRHLWTALKALLADSVTWKGIVFLFVKFPLGILSFVVVVVVVCVSVSLMLVPLLYRRVSITGIFGEVASAEEAFLCFVFGVLAFILGIQVTNGLAYVWRVFAQFMLGGGPGAAGAPSEPRPIVIP